MDNIFTPLFSFVAPSMIMPIRDLASVALELVMNGPGEEPANKKAAVNVMYNTGIKKMAESLKGEKRSEL